MSKTDLEPYAEVVSRTKANPAAMIAMAQKHIGEVSAAYGKGWRMSIPVRAEDSDMLLSGVIDALAEMAGVKSQADAVR